MDNYNEYLINLLIKCGNDDTTAINEYNETLWHNRHKQITFNENFVNRITKLAYEDNNSYCQNILGLMYETNKGVELNYAKSKALYKLAIKKNNTYSMINLGYLYKDGYGTKKNIPKALKLFEQAFLMGNLDAAENLENVLGYNICGATDEKMSDFYIKAIKLSIAKKKKKEFQHFMTKVLFAYVKIDTKELIAIITNPNINELYDGDLPYQIVLLKQVLCYANREISKTILLTKKIPVEIIETEILPKI